MTTSQVPQAAEGDDTPTLRLDDGPLGEAMAAVDRAVTGIEEAEDALAARRRDLADVLSEQLAAVLAAEPDDVVAEVRPTLAALYWDHAEVIRVKDLTDATGLSGAQLRTVVGSRTTEVSCDGCGMPMQVVRTSRSQPVRSECGACRWSPSRPSPWDGEGPGDPLQRLVDHLAAAVASSGCDGSLHRTRAWAAATGRDPEALAVEVRSHGAHCDCEVALNLPLPRR